MINNFEAIEQLKKCGYKDEQGHKIENNAAFIWLENMQDKETPKYELGREYEVEVFGEIEGIRTSVKKNGICLKIIREFIQLDGKDCAKWHNFAFFYNVGTINNSFKLEETRPFLKEKF